MGDEVCVASDKLPMESKRDLLCTLSAVAYGEESGYLIRLKDGYIETNQMILRRFEIVKPEPFSVYFGYIGFDIVIDRENGVVMLRNCADVGENGKLQANRFQLKKAESVVLCCLWTLYADRVRSGSLSKSILISITDLRFELEKYGLKEQTDKTAMGNILTLLSKFNLIDVNGRIGDADCLIRLYPSLQFALDVDTTKKRMGEKTGEATVDEDEEDEDADE